MQLFYNGAALHQLGELRVGGQRFTPEGAADAPDRIRTRLEVTLDVMQPGFTDNRLLIEQVLAALKTQNGVLLWKDEVSGVEFVNRTATVADHSLPQDPNAWGTYHQQVMMAFEWVELSTASNGLSMTYQPTGSEVISTLEAVRDFRTEYATRRYAEMRSHRERAGGRVSCAGRIEGNPAASLEDRRADLLARKAALDAAMVATKDGRLRYGAAFDQVVRVSAWDCQVNHAVTGIDWALEASWTAFPNEAGYALVEYEARRVENQEDNTVRLHLSGRVGAQDLAAAQARLATLRTAVRGAQAPATTSVVSQSVADREVSADTDGDTFIELRFDDEYKVHKAGAVTDWELVMQDVEDPSGGVFRRTYSGSVTAKATTWATAYQAAYAQARALSWGKAALLRGASFSARDRQSSDAVTTTNEKQCVVQFAVEYQLKGTRMTMEVSMETIRDTFGPGMNSVRGSVTSSDEAAARAEFTALKATYAGQLIREERVTANRVRQSLEGGVSAGARTTPPESGGWGVTVNTGETASGGVVEQVTRLEFSFLVHVPKGSGDTALRYSSVTHGDYLARQWSTRLQGSVWCDTRETADAVIALVMPAGNLVENEVTEERERFLGVVASTADDLPPPSSGPVTYLIRVDFSVTVLAAMAEADLILQCRVTEETGFSGPRLVTRATAFGRDVVQSCGIRAGRRSVRGEVRAASEAAAVGWARRQYHLPFGTTGLPGAPVTRHRHPPEWSLTTETLPLNDLVTRAGGPEYTGGGSPNVTVWALSFAMEEVLPDYDYVV